MSTDRDVTRQLRSWLKEDRHEDADRVLDLVLDQLDTTPRRQPLWLAWRRTSMNTYLRVGAVAATLLIAAVIGIQVFSAGPNVSGPGPTVTPSPSPLPSPTQEAWLAGPIQTGRNDATLRGIGFSFRIPSDSTVGTGGWVRTQFDGMINKFPPGNWIGFLNEFDVVASDPCAGTTTPVGQSVEDMANALTTIPGTEADEPVDANVGELPAKLMTLTINDDIECVAQNFWIYGPASAYPNSVDSTIRIWVFELDGSRYMIHSNQEGSDADQAQEITEIVESIQFD